MQTAEDIMKIFQKSAGWNDETALGLVLDFIDDIAMTDDFAAHLEDKEALERSYDNG